MAKKKDASVAFLNKFGYNVLKVPRVGVEPMDVIGTDKTTQWLGPLRSVWTSSVAEPRPSAPQPAAALAGQQTDQLDVSFGLEILASALAAFGAAVPSLNVAYTGARKVQFSYTDVTSTVVAPFDAGNYLTSGILNTDNPVVKHYFADPEAQAFLILEVLKSDSITVTASDDRGENIAVDVPSIQGVVGANVSVKAGAAGNTSVTFSGKVPATFGFIVDQIEFDGSKWSLSGAAASGALSFGAGLGDAQPSSAPILLGTGCRLGI